MKEQSEEAKKEKAKREGGTYMPGIGMDGGYVLDVPPKAPKKKRPVYVCPLPLCGLKGHKTKRSKNCKYNPQNPEYVGDDAANGMDVDQKLPAAGNQTQRDAEEQELMDALPLDDEFYSAEEFSSEASSNVDSSINDAVDVDADITDHEDDDETE